MSVMSEVRPRDHFGFNVRFARKRSIRHRYSINLVGEQSQGNGRPRVVTGAKAQVE
jgi:hypothetical protein